LTLRGAETKGEEKKEDISSGKLGGKRRKEGGNKTGKPTEDG